MSALHRLSVLIIAVSVTVFVANARGQAQQQPKRIGFLAGVSHSAIVSRLNAFRQGLRNLGYLENKNILIESRYAEGNVQRLREFAAELVHLNVHVIVTGGPPATRATQAATSLIPIVMGFDGDPVGNGFVASLGRPGANITGLSAISPEISGKQLELLKEVVPKLSQIAVIGSSAEPANARILKELKIAAKVLGLTMHSIEIADSKSIEDGLRAATKSGAGAALVLPSLFTYTERADFVGLAARNRLPTMYGSGEFVNAGGLMSYGTDYLDLFRRAATYVDKILKGTKPADLPVEQPTKFELVNNLKTAKQIGVTIPQRVLARADKVIR